MIFPIDCRDCKYFYSYDLSIDDLVFGCKFMDIEVDACDVDFVPLPKCPIN